MTFMLVFLVGFAGSAKGEPLPLPADIGGRLAHLKLINYSGDLDMALAVFDLNGDRWFNFGDTRQMASPCSTFKIFNALAGLDSGVVAVDTVFKWDGSTQHFKTWERDHSLHSAFKYSTVWYYQELARRLGPARMQAYVDGVEYGNRDISAGIDRFWLGSSLQISPMNQVIFLKRLYRNELPFSVEASKAVREMMVHHRGEDYVLSGKTGSDWRDGHYTLGWFVGHLESGGHRLVFALLTKGEGANGIGARRIMGQIFVDLLLVPNPVP